MIVALVLAAAQPAAPAATPAPDWRLIGTHQDRNLFYDAARIERGPEVVTVRIRNAAVLAPDTSPYALSRLEIRCTAAQLRVVETISYRPDGTIIRTDSVPQPFESIPSGSFVAIVQHAVC
jgi:hypothetical protein